MDKSVEAAKHLIIKSGYPIDYEELNSMSN